MFVSLLRLLAPLFFSPERRKRRPRRNRRHNILSTLSPFSGRLFPIALLLTVCAGAYPAVAQPSVMVEISGDLNEQEMLNIRSHLSLAKLPDNDAIPEVIFNRLYRKARQETAKALEPFGYYTPEITTTTRMEGSLRHVEIKVAKALPVLVADVTITLSGPGEHDAQLNEAIRQFPVRQGDVLNHQAYENSKDRLIAIAMGNGYYRATFRNSRVEISRKAHSASIHLNLDSGPRYLVGPLTFATDSIDHDLLRRISPVREGDPFSPRALTRLRQSLFNVGYFKTVELEYDLDHAVDSKVPINVTLVPNLAHKYGIGLGYGTDTGVRGTLEYTNRYINRFGHQLVLHLQPAQRKSNFGTTYTIPIDDPQKGRIALTAKYETEEFDDTDIQTLNATVSHDHFLEWGEYSTYIQFLDERYSTGPENTSQANLIIPGVKGSVFWADDRVTTKRGIRFTATVIGSEKNVLADTSFLQATLRTKAIYSFSDQWRLLGRGEIGTTIVDDIYRLPPTLRYYTGGDQSVRGYGYKKISPVNANGNVIGGKNLLTYSVELERTLFDAWSGAIFYDSGDVTNDFAKITLRSGAGVGVRWNGVFGQVRLDIAKALDEERSWRLHFTIGADL
jgi:Outer membrane protein